MKNINRQALISIFEMKICLVFAEEKLLFAQF